MDLGFYHQLIENHPAFREGQDVFQDRASQVNRVVVYSCQAPAKITSDLGGICLLPLVEWRWLSYIPIGFAYFRHYRSDRHPFDVGLLGSAGRDYAQIDPDRFRGTRFLFVGDAAAPGIEALAARVDLTIASRVDEDTYARLLALCKCVVLPVHVHYPVSNVFMSVLDTIATGKALVTSPHPGLARLERDELPAGVFYDATPDDLARKVSDLLARQERREAIETRSIAFAKERLDIYRVLSTIFEEQVL
jgi:glycosyltransferase involved in cell wall biosynthesis